MMPPDGFGDGDGGGEGYDWSHLMDDVGEQSDDPGRFYRFDDAEGAETTNTVFLTKMWGSTVKLQIVDITPNEGISIQLADVHMPEPLVTSVFFQASFSSGTGTVLALTWNLHQGLGRTTVNRREIFATQPTPSSDLTVTLELVPMVQMLSDVVVRGFADPGSPEIVNLPGGGTAPAFTLDLSMQVAPITRAKIDTDSMRFGMALPGEADSLDDELLEPLEKKHPGVRAILDTTAEPAAPLDGFAEVAHALAQRLGRQPNQHELLAAVARINARRARRGPRGARAPAAAAPAARAPGSPQRRAFIERVIHVMTGKLGRKPTKDELRAALATLQVPP